MNLALKICGLLVLIGFSGILFFEDVKAKQSEEFPQVLLQLQIRNSEGQLVSYVEGTKIIKIQPILLNNYLDEKPNKKIIVKEGKKYELIQWQGRTETFDKVHAHTIFNLWTQIDGAWVSPLGIIHNTYQVMPGDTITVYWTIIRPS